MYQNRVVAAGAEETSRNGCVESPLGWRRPNGWMKPKVSLK